MPSVSGIVWQVEFAIHQFPPLGEDILNSLVAVRDLPVHQLDVKIIAVNTHVDNVEPTGRGPNVFRPDREGNNVIFLQLLCGRDEFLPGLRNGDAELLEDVFSVENPPKRVNRRNTPLLSVHRHGGKRRAKVLVPVVLLPQIRDVVEQATIDKRLHPVAGKPKNNVRRFGGEPISDRGLVAFVISRIEYDFQVGVLLLEVFHDLGEDAFVVGIRLIRVDDKLFRVNGESSEKSDSEGENEFNLCHRFGRVDFSVWGTALA